MIKAIDYLKEAGVSDKDINPYIIKAMDAYAKQMAIDFTDWKMTNWASVRFLHNLKTTEEAFQYYLMEKSNL